MQGTTRFGLPKTSDSSGPKLCRLKAPVPDEASGGPSLPVLRVFTRKKKRSNEAVLIEQKQTTVKSLLSPKGDEVHENRMLKLEKVEADLDKRMQLAKLKLQQTERLLKLAEKQKEEREEFYGRLIKIQTQLYEKHIVQLGVACLRGLINVMNVLEKKRKGEGVPRSRMKREPRKKTPGRNDVGMFSS